MEIKTDEGIAKPLPLSDIQEYNRRLEENTQELRRRNKIDFIEMLIKIILVVVFLSLLYYAFDVDFFNNVIRELGGCG